MTVFRRKSTFRSIAAHLLLLWVFALAAGVVHACSLASKSNPPDRATIVAATIDVHRHDRAAHDHGRGADAAGKATCVKFCADAKALSTTPDLGSGDLTQAPLYVLWPMVRTDVQRLSGAKLSARVWWRDMRPPRSIAIQFLRLAL